MNGKLYARKRAWLGMNDEAGRIYLLPMVDAYMVRPYSEIATYLLMIM